MENKNDKGKVIDLLLERRSTSKFYMKPFILRKAAGNCEEFDCDENYGKLKAHYSIL